MSDLSSATPGPILRIAGVTAAACKWLAVIAIFLMFAVVALNILMRALFDATGGAVNLLFQGGFELSRYALLIAVFAALPASIANGLIKVDVLTAWLPPLVQRLLARFWFLLLLVFAAVLTWLFGLQIGETWRAGETSQDLGIPIWLFYLIITLECACFVIVALAETLYAEPAQAEME